MIVWFWSLPTTDILGVSKGDINDRAENAKIAENAKELEWFVQRTQWMKAVRPLVD